MRKKLFLLISLVLCLTTSVMAQVTTSGINGRVVASDEKIIGATVTAVHEPSGTKYNAVTNADGRYTIQGMRVGGPYTVTIDYIGFKQEVRHNIYLALGNSEAINVDMKEDAQQLGEVTVTGKAGNHGNGAATNFSRQSIENAPTVDRNIYDVAKLSPLVNVNTHGGITIAGQNNRYNSFQIDGMVANDVFGLSASGTNGGQTGTNPISLDAIDQIQIVASPFDVRQSGFTGGAINAITKSGTNKFQGTAYAYYTNEDLYGKYSQYYNRKQKLNKQDTKTYGFTFGGPIIKDKLFFFASAEFKKLLYPQTLYAGADGYFLSAATAKAMADRYYEVTGIQESWGIRDIERQGLSLLGRLDWNINTDNHLSFRYQGNFSHDDNVSVGTYSYMFNNSGYRMKDRTNSYVAEWTSHISDEVYNEFRAGATFVRDNRVTAYQGPTIYISQSPYVNLGTEYSSGVNFLNQDIYTIENNLSLYQGDHTFTFGVHGEYYDMSNAFIQASNGEYVYDTVDQFLADANPSSYVFKYTDKALTGSSSWAAPFRAGILGVYVQDKWTPSTRFELTYGLRLDAPFYFNKPRYNDAFNSTVNWAEKYGVRVGRRPATEVNASPRLGFRWFVDKEHKGVLRGGVGLFNGRTPFVWIENAWANTGMEMKSINARGSRTNPIPTFTASGKMTPEQIVSALGATSGAQDIVTVDHRFRQPQAFRANLAWEQQLPWGVKMTLEALYSRNLNAVWFENLVLNAQGKVYAVPGVESSATTYFSSNQTSPTTDGGSYKANSVINLTNINKGHSYSFSAQLEKSFDFGLDVLASYTFGHSYSVNDGTSSVASSNWKYWYSVDPTTPALSYSSFDIPHKVMVQLNYNTKRYGNGRWQTHVGLTYNGMSGSRYSLTMSDGQSASFNGDYAKGNSLVYIPTKEELAKMNFVDKVKKDGQVLATAAEQKEQFEQWINSNEYAKNHRGQYAKRNSVQTPWENHFDLHLTQDFFYLKERGSKVSLVFDILNVGNLINKHWGEVYSGPWNVDILSVTGTSFDRNTKIATPSYNFVGNTATVSDVSSRWQMQLGLRVTF